jgi:hypothetical protein
MGAAESSPTKLILVLQNSVFIVVSSYGGGTTHGTHLGASCGGGRRELARVGVATRSIFRVGGKTPQGPDGVGNPSNGGGGAPRRSVRHRCVPRGGRAAWRRQ